MRLLCMGDLHYRASTPRSRLDDYVGAMRGKMEQIFRTAREQECSYLLQPGDFFDNPTPPLWLLGEVLQRHWGQDCQTLAVLGQHDQRYHYNKVENTPLGVLEAAGAVELLRGRLPYLDGAEEDVPVALYGCSWSEDPPKPRKGCVNVLLIHRMMIQEKLWAGQEEFTRARAFLRSHEFDLVVSGDNHQFFTESYQGRHLVNCGSLMRSNSDQKGHHPTVVVYDSVERSITPVPLDVAPAAEVLAESEAAADRERNAELEAFVEQVGGNQRPPDLDFTSNLHALAKEAPTPVRDKIEAILEMSQ